jgi:predicted TPR repeat methyltransferase
MGKQSSKIVANNAPKLSSLIQQAITAHQAGQLHQAEAFLKAVLELDAGNFDAHYRLAVIRSQLQRPGEALETYDRALAVNAAHAGAHNNRGKALQELRRFAEALASHDRALALRPDSADAMAARADALHGLKRFEEALSSYDRALAINPHNGDTWYNRGNSLRELKRLDQAIASYDRALAMEPNNAEAWNNRGNCLQALRRFDEASASYGKAIVINPAYAEADCNAGSLAIERGNFAEAIDCFKRALSRKPELAEARINLGLALVEHGNVAEAVAEARAAAGFADDQSFPRYAFGNLLAKCGMTDEARVQFDRCLAEDPEDRQGARLYLAALGSGPLPERAPDALIADVYASRAAFWDRGIAGAQSYRGAELVGRTVERLSVGNNNLDILDVGCGTGLVGLLVRSRARRLDGIDLSSAMLEKAKEKGVYNELHHDDLVAFFAKRPQSYDVLTAAATLIHFGDLRPAFDAAAVALRDGGLFVFTVFPYDEDPGGFGVGSADGLLQAGCYAHGSRYVARTAETAGFAVEQLDRDIHEYYQGEPRFGLVVALRRGAPNRVP